MPTEHGVNTPNSNINSNFAINTNYNDGNLASQQNQNKRFQDIVSFDIKFYAMGPWSEMFINKTVSSLCATALRLVLIFKNLHEML